MEHVEQHPEWDSYYRHSEAGLLRKDIARLRAELDNRQMQLDGEHTTCVELSRHVYDLEEELTQAHKWAAAWKEWAKWAFHYWRHNSACASFAEEEAA